MHDVSEIADSIQRIDQGMQQLKASGLSERAIIALLQDATGLSKTPIREVLGALSNMKKLYLAPKPKP